MKNRLSTAIQCLIVALWGGELLYSCAPFPMLKRMASIGLLVALILIFLDARRITRVLCAALAMISVALAWQQQEWGLVAQGLEASLLFTAFIPTTLLVWATFKQQLPAVYVRAEASTADGAASRQGAEMLHSAHLLGAILGMSAFGVVVQLVPADADVAARRRLAQAAVRGVCLTAFWSPFLVGLAVISSQMPSVPTWQLIAAGILLSVLGLCTAQRMYAKGAGPEVVATTFRKLLPMLPALLVAAGAVMLCAIVTGLKTLQAVSLVMPPLCLVWVMAVQRAPILPVLRTTVAGVGRIRDELLLVTSSQVLGKLFANHIASTASASALVPHLPAAFVFGAVILCMIAAAMVAIHPMITATLILGLLRGRTSELAPLALSEAVLCGWVLGTMVSVASLAVGMAAMIFRVPIEQVAFGNSSRYAFVFGALVVLLLTIWNIVPH